MLGIGLGIDYGLLMVNRFREERGHGPRGPRGRRRHGRLGRHHRGVLGAHRGRRHVRAVRVRRAAAHLVRHRRARRWCCCRMFAAVTLLPATLAAVGGRIKPIGPGPRRRRPLLPAHPVGAGPAGRRSVARRRWCWCCSASRSSAPASRTATPARCPAPPRCGPRRSLLADRFPARGTDPVTVIADDRRRRPRVHGLARRRGRRRRRRRALDPAGHPGRDHRGRPRRRPARRRARRPRTSSTRSAPSDTDFDTQVGGPAAELARREGQAQRPAAARGRHGRAWPRWCCCS